MDALAVILVHPALSGIGKIIESLWPILHISESMKNVFEEKPMVAYRRPRNIKDVIVCSKINSVNIDKVMRECGTEITMSNL